MRTLQGEKMDYAAILKHNFEELELPADAQDWLISLWNVIQALDDVVDGDAVERDSMMAVIWAIFAKMPMNPFYDANRAYLTPNLAMCVMKWIASDTVERDGNASEKSYMWRAGYYDIVALVAGLVHGPASPQVWKSLELYGEGLQEYLGEFPNA